MEVPASLYALRVPAPKAPRRLNGVELALAGLVYSHAVIGQSVPFCAVPIETVAEMIGGGLARVRDASRSLARAGYWRRVQVGSCLWRWEIVILPSDPGHRWCDIRSLPPADPGQAGSEVGRPYQAQAGSGLGKPDPGVAISGLGRPDQGYLGRPDPANQDQEQIRDASGARASVPRLALASAIDAQAERYETARAAHAPTRMADTGTGSMEAALLRERFLAVLERYQAGTLERSRLAACRLATPVAEVLRRTCEDMGGLERVADVLAWAWEEHAHGRLALGRAEPAAALRDVFRGEGRYWSGILDAFGRAQPRQQRLDEWRPPEFDAGEDVDPRAWDAMLEGLGR